MKFISCPSVGRISELIDDMLRVAVVLASHSETKTILPPIRTYKSSANVKKHQTCLDINRPGSFSCIS